MYTFVYIYIYIYIYSRVTLVQGPAREWFNHPSPPPPPIPSHSQSHLTPQPHHLPGGHQQKGCMYICPADVPGHQKGATRGTPAGRPARHQQGAPRDTRRAPGHHRVPQGTCGVLPGTTPRVPPRGTPECPRESRCTEYASGTLGYPGYPTVAGGWAGVARGPGVPRGTTSYPEIPWGTPGTPRVLRDVPALSLPGMSPGPPTGVPWGYLWGTPGVPLTPGVPVLWGTLRSTLEYQ